MRCLPSKLPNLGPGDHNCTHTRPHTLHTHTEKEAEKEDAARGGGHMKVPTKQIESFLKSFKFSRMSPSDILEPGSKDR